jgi:hypothetical protein
MNPENTDNKDFPSLFVQAENLVKQAISSGTDALKGKPLVASTEKAKARLDICAACEFFHQGRCLKCGCFMNKKAHLESARCPINKWGDLQKLYLQNSISVSINDFPLQERETIIAIANHAADIGNAFYHNNIPYKSKKNEDGGVSIFLYNNEPRRHTGTITSGFTAEELTEFNQLVRTSKNTEDKVFSFKGSNYKITVDGNKTSISYV